MKVLGLCGSLRAASMNAALLRASARVAPTGLSIELFAGIGELPLFNPDIEFPSPPAVQRLHAAVERCDALLIASPEYAHGVTAVLKNALDWLVSFEPFIDKRVAIFNASPRSVHADAALREILVTMSASLMTDACLALPLRATGVDEEAIVREHGERIRAALSRILHPSPVQNGG